MLSKTGFFFCLISANFLFFLNVFSNLLHFSFFFFWVFLFMFLAVPNGDLK